MVWDTIPYIHGPDQFDLRDDTSSSVGPPPLFTHLLMVLSYFIHCMNVQGSRDSNSVNSGNSYHRPLGPPIEKGLFPLQRSWST